MRLVFNSLVFFFCIMTSCLNAKESLFNEAKIIKFLKSNTFSDINNISTLKKKIKSVDILDASKIDNQTILRIEKLDCLIIDNYKKNIDEKIFYSLLNHLKQLDKYFVINSILPIKKMKFELEDLRSRSEVFVSLGIELPTDDLLRVIISKSFSDKQIDISPKLSEYIIKNIERSYEKVFKFIKEIDDLSLSSGKSININLIKKVLANE